MSEPVAETNKIPLSITLRLFLPVALGYFLSQHFSAVNAIISSDLVRDTGIDAFQLGTVTGVYFLAFAAAQLPLGILLDKYGPRRTEAALLIFAAVGAALFGSAHGIEQLILGRLLIGFGVSCCLMAAFKAFVMWLPSFQLPFANGCLMAAGALGILASTIPVEAALQFTDWRVVFYGLAVLTLLAALLVYLVIPDQRTEAEAEGFKQQLVGLALIFRSGYFWRVVPFAVIVEGGIIGIFTLWTAPWLRDVAGFSREEVASGMFMIALSMIIGFPFFGFLASRLNKMGISTMKVAIVGMIISIALGAVVLFQMTEHLLAAWMLFMFFATSSILVFAAMSQHFPKKLSGRVNTALNFLLFLGAFITQVGIGAILNRFEVPMGTAGYSLEGYQLVAQVFVGIQAVGLLWFLISSQFLGKQTTQYTDPKT
jgi:MFS family permease